MAKIKIEDLPKDVKVSKEELRRVIGGAISGGYVRPGVGLMSTSLLKIEKVKEYHDLVAVEPTTFP